MEAVLFSLLGVMLGTVTGLIPGLHVNLIATLAVSAGLQARAAPFFVAMAITHTFLDSIPAILLGAPEADTALGVLPGHRYLLRGWGLMAIKLTLVGSLVGMLVGLLLAPLWLQVLRLYPYFRAGIGWALLVIAAYMILRDRKPGWSLTVFLGSATLGALVLDGGTVTDPLFPLLSGLFGISTLLYSIGQGEEVPEQRISTEIRLRGGDALRALLAGNVSGFLTSMLPGVGAAQAAVLGSKLSGRVGDHGFMILLGTINTVNFVLSLLAWLTLDVARNGIVVALQQITVPSSLLILRLIAVALLAAGFATAAGLFLGRVGVRMLSRVPYRTLSLGVIALIVALVWSLTGWRGILVLATATAVGLVPAVVRCSRAHAMGCLMLPVALYLL